MSAADEESAADRATLTFTVTVTALPDPEGTPAAVRARRWLKQGLRAFGLRCLDGREVAEAAVLRQLVNALARRVADQADQLARLAERRDAH